MAWRGGFIPFLAAAVLGLSLAPSPNASKANPIPAQGDAQANPNGPDIAADSHPGRIPGANADLDVSESFLERATALLAAREYGSSTTPHGLQAPNRAHRLRTYFEPTGIRVVDREHEASGALLNLSLQRFGRGTRLADVPSGEVASAEGGRVEIVRESLGLVEWFVNGPAGLEQGFDIERPPGERPRASEDDGRPGRTEGGAASSRAPLVLELAVAGARATLRGDAIVLTTDQGRTLRYGTLFAVDAEGIRLASRFEVPDPSRIRIAVDDAQARYPIVVDPLLTSAWDALLESDQADAFFARSFASAGDVNGDGYGDLVIGAPFYDAGTIDEGAAFIFHGSPAGIGDASPAIAATQLESNAGGGAFFGPLFGSSVASAGDVDGDGYDDVIVGSPSYGGGGGAFVFRGSATGVADGNPISAHARLTSPELESAFGTSVASAGDVNGDGFDDVIVGATNFDAVIFNEGAAFVFVGSASGVADATTASAHAILRSDQGGFPSGSSMGQSVASAGDVNADGYADVIVGAPRYDSGAQGGAAFVYLGSATGIASTLPAGAHAILTPEANAAGLQAAMGTSVASAGDTNGDGYSEVIVGAPAYGTTDHGGAFVFAGSPTGIASGTPADALTNLLTAGYALAQFGRTVAGLGDVNGDGFADVAAAAYGGINGSPEVQFHFGAISGIQDSPPSLIYLRVRNDAARSIAAAGDVNGDGYADVIVGYDSIANPETNEGVALVLHGSTHGILAPPSSLPLDLSAPSIGWQVRGLTVSNQAGAELGTTVASAGDVNGDGRSDFLVGAPGYDFGETNEGAAFLFLGNDLWALDTEPGSAHARFEGNQTGARLGTSVSAAGDVNGDGYGDLIVGAPLWDSPETDEGGAFVFLGGPLGVLNGSPATAHARIQSNWAGSELGTSVASAGDTNGDGFGDVIVGAPRFSGGEAFEGAAFVFNGSANGLSDGDPFTTFGWIQANQDAQLLGNSVASAGDVNGDGYGDVIVGCAACESGQGASEGSAFVYHGSPSGIFFEDFTTADARIDADQGIAELGTSVASAGDVNGDGFDDVVVGAPRYDAGQGDEGAAFVFLGSANGIGSGSATTADARIECDQIGANCGGSVASAGDLDGDGFADLVVGAAGYDEVYFEEGVALVFQGSAAGIASGNPASATSLIRSGQYQAGLGSSVAGAGDLNGDGFADLLLGTPHYATGELDEGAAFTLLANTLFHPGANRSALARQRRVGSAAPIAPGGGADASTGFAVELFVRSPHGRERARIEVELCPAGSAFGSVDCILRESPSWADLGTSGATLSQPITGLATNTTWHWRARAHFTSYAPAAPGPEEIGSPGPWFRQLASTTTVDVRIVPEPEGVLGLLAALGLLSRLRRRASRAASSH